MRVRVMPIRGARTYNVHIGNQRDAARAGPR